jgi:hypothetical protein
MIIRKNFLLLFFCFFFNVCYALFFSSLYLKLNWWESDSQPELRCYLHWSQMVQLERDFHYWRTAWLSFHQPVTRRRRERKKRNDHVKQWNVYVQGYNWSMGFVCFSLFSLSFCSILPRSPTASSSIVKRAHSFSITSATRTTYKKKEVWLDESRQHRVGHKKK